jgi:predicted RNase H-like nuclease (RuvC/YqgF family)
VDSLDKKVQSLDKQVQSLDKKVQTLDKKVDSLDKKVQTLDKRVDSLEVTLKRKIDDNQSELMGLLRGLSAEVKEGFTHLETQLKRES